MSGRCSSSAWRPWEIGPGSRWPLTLGIPLLSPGPAIVGTTPTRPRPALRGGEGTTGSAHPSQVLPSGKPQHVPCQAQEAGGQTCGGPASRQGVWVRPQPQMATGPHSCPGPASLGPKSLSCDHVLLFVLTLLLYLNKLILSGKCLILK